MGRQAACRKVKLHGLGCKKVRRKPRPYPWSFFTTTMLSAPDFWESQNRPWRR